MDIRKIFEIQKKLDETIQKAHNVKPDEVLKRKIIALYIEIGEFANEIAAFKYWKKNKEISKEKALEEFADCIHFFATFYVYKDIKKTVAHAPVEEINGMFLKLFKSISKMEEDLSEENLDFAFSIFLGIGDVLKFDWDEVEKHYLLKNKINHDRIKNNY